MRPKISLIKKSLIRLLALMMTVSLVPSSLCLDAYAAETETTAAARQADESEEDEEEEDDSPKMEIYKNGEVYNTEITTGGDWSESTVTGSLEPLLSVDEEEPFYTNNITVTPDSGLYTLTVATGINPGTSVEYFAIRYTDTLGQAQTKYIFPTADRQALADSYISGLEATTSLRNWRTTTVTGYTFTKTEDGTYGIGSYVVGIDETDIEKAKRQFSSVIEVKKSYTNYTAAATNDLARPVKARNAILESLGYSASTDFAGSYGLDAWSIKELLFKTKTPISKVNSIDVFMSNGKWTVQGMTVSKVNSIKGYGEYGFFSGKYFLGLDKQLICQLQSKKSGTQTFNANGDTLLNIGGKSSIYYGLQELNETKEAAFNDLYTFRLDFSDTPDGGIESLLRTNAKTSGPTDGAVAEHLALEVSYKDVNGWTRSVTMPVLLSVLGQYKQWGDTVRTMGLAQRGDTLAFTANLPEFSSLISARLLVGKAARDKINADGKIAPIGSSRERDRLITALDSDYIRLAGISMYKGSCRMSNTPDGADSVTKEILKSYSYTFAYSESAPMIYNTTTNPQGTRINPGASDAFKMTAYNGKAPLIAAQYSGNVLISLKTDSIKGAEPTGTTRIRLTYQDTSGTEMTSSFYNIKDEVLNYLGYWPTQTAANDNFGYSYGVQAGNVVEFPVQLSDVAVITSVEINVGEDSSDWQVAGISVAVASDIGKRRIYAKTQTANEITSDYKIVRSMNRTVIPPFPLDLKLLVTSGDSFSFNTGEGTIVTSREADFNAVRYSMSYNQTKENYGYAKTRKIYDVAVQVAEDPDAGNFNGDSGSSNHFYFQLRFKNGKSGFVLANQQLSSDAFRAGCEETFSIQINRDYGDLAEIRIIPQDVSEDNDVFDKLNVDQITVTERTSGGSADQYVFDNVGWIGIDYNDKSEDSAVKIRAGRSLEEIARKYKLSYKQKVVNILCEIKTLPWDTDYLPVEGSISCDLNYIDADGQPHTKSFDVISRMASYMNKTAKSVESSGDAAAPSVYSNMGTVSDPNWMLRPNHTDRFILPSLVNAKTITSMTFTATSRNNKPAKWVIGGVDLLRIKTDSGVVTLTANNNSTDGEYVRSMQTLPLAHMVLRSDKEYEELLLPAGEPQKLTVYFDEHTINWAENSSWTSSVSKFPESSNDTLNVFIFPSSKTRNIEDVSVSAALQFNIANSRVMQSKQSVLNVYGSGTEDAMFYYSGLPATDMQSMSSLSIQCRNSKISFDHAIVQQVREGVVVMTYTFNFGGASATLGLKALPSAYTKVYDPRKQTLMVSFGADTTEMALFGMSDDNLNPNDIAVCLKYRSTLDRSSEYYTPYVYLTETGVNKIYPGLMAEFGFNIPYLAEIIGYRIVSFGNIKATVDSAVGLNYTCSDQDPEAAKLENVYSFNNSFEAGNIPREFESVKGTSGEGTVLPLDIYFTTAQAAENTESGINVPVSAEFTYTDSKGETHTRNIRDIRQYIQSDSKQFPTGEKTLVRLLLPECSELSSIKLTPSSGSWKIDSIEIKSLGEELVNRKVDTVFTEDGQSITLKDLTLSTSVTADGKYKGRVENHEKNIKLEGGKLVSGTVILKKTDEGFDMRVDLLSNGILTDITEEISSRNDSAFAVTIPVNESSVPMNYIITIWAVENPSIKDVINVTVPAEAQRITVDTSTSSSSAAQPDTTSSTPVSDSSSIPDTSSQEEQSDESSTDTGTDESSEPEKAENTPADETDEAEGTEEPSPEEG